MRQVYLYHRSEDPKVFPESDIDKMKKEGWDVSPLPFIKTTDFGVDPEEQEKVQMLGETILGVRDCLNGLLNLDIMPMKELKAFAKTHCPDLKRSRYRNKKSLIFAIKEHQGWQQQATSSKVH